jgi:hypothetical protein
MDKVKQKRTTYNDAVIKGLMERYGFKRNYIIKSISGERNGTLSIKIQEEYKVLNAATNNVLKTKIKNL